MTRCVETEIAIVGGGPAGLAAATAAVSAGKSVAVIDDNPQFGGQIWRAQRGQLNQRTAQMLAKIESSKLFTPLAGAQVFDAATQQLAAETSADAFVVRYQRLIITTGARERFVPFPGWTSPSVTGVGGVQALVKGGSDVAGKRIVVAGSGPLIIAVASFLRNHGAKVVAVAEQASQRDALKFLLTLRRFPGKLLEAVRTRASIIGTRIWFDSYVRRFDEADGESSFVTVRTPGGDRELHCDLLATGYHLVPNTELAALIGCRLKDGCVAVDDDQRTSVDGVFCAGEPTGVGGVELALVEGEIAGRVAAGQQISADLRQKQQKWRNFAAALNEYCQLRPELRSLAAPTTLVCRCEDVTLAEIADCAGFRDAKLRTRVGMGACRGRVCGAGLNFLRGWSETSVRPPLFPVRGENLGLLSEEN